MKVVFVASDNNPASGAFLSMVALNKILRDQFGVDTFVVLPRSGNGTVLLQENNIPHEIIKSHDWVVPQEESTGLKFWLKKTAKQILNIRAAFRISRLLKREHADIVHINTTYAYIGAKAAKMAQIPFIWHLREFVEEDQGRTLWNREKGNRLIAQADRAIAISSSVYDKYKDVVDASRLGIILNGIDTTRFYRPEKEIFQNEKFTLIYGGGYATRKGIYELASALELLVEWGFTNFEVFMVGEANDKYKKHLSKVGLAPYVRYLGYQKDVAQWYEKSDIAFSCSAAEAFGRKTVEAMLCGTLMIAANTGGTLDIVEDGKTGILYQQGDPIDLAVKILYAMNHTQECAEMAARGREYANENLSALKNATAVYEEYRKLLAVKVK